MTMTDILLLYISSITLIDSIMVSGAGRDATSNKSRFGELKIPRQMHNAAVLPIDGDSSSKMRCATLWPASMLAERFLTKTITSRFWTNTLKARSCLLYLQANARSQTSNPDNETYEIEGCKKQHCRLASERMFVVISTCKRRILGSDRPFGVDLLILNKHNKTVQ